MKTSLKADRFSSHSQHLKFTQLLQVFKKSDIFNSRSQHLKQILIKTSGIKTLKLKRYPPFMISSNPGLLQ